MEMDVKTQNINDEIEQSYHLNDQEGTKIKNQILTGR